VDYALPEDGLILEAALDALRQRRTMRSESALLRAVRERLRKADPKATVGRRRLRLVCLKSGKVEVTAFTRFSNERRAISRCPVCRGAIKPIRNRTVYDGSVTLGYRCLVCGYWTGIRRRIPTLYMYARRAPGTAADGELRSIRLVPAERQSPE
jgi:hypothetical protein